jgi:hypothetical protein
MKAMCILYQMTNNIVREKNGKKAVKMKDCVVTKELLNEYPELKTGVDLGKFSLGQTIRLPENPRAENLERVQEFDMDSEFIFPEVFGFPPEENEKIWKDKHKEASLKLDDKVDYQRQLVNHLRWFIQNGWSICGYNGTHYVLELSLNCRKQRSPEEMKTAFEELIMSFGMQNFEQWANRHNLKGTEDEFLEYVEKQMRKLQHLTKK